MAEKTQLAVRLAAPLAEAPAVTVDYNDPEIIKVIKAEICPPGTSETEFLLFLDKCRQSGLNPLLGECFCVERWSRVKNGPGYDDYQNVKKNQFQAAEAGMAARAERFDDYRGIKFGAIYEMDHCDINTGTGVVDHRYSLTGDRGKLIAAWAQVQRDGYFFSPDIVYLKDFEQRIKGNGKNAGELTSMWQKPDLMLPKCARAAAYRRAFPKPFAGVYAREELRDEDEGAPNSPTPTGGGKPKGTRMDRLEARVTSQLPAQTTVTVQIPAREQVVEHNPVKSSTPEKPDASDRRHVTTATEEVGQTKQSTAPSSPPASTKTEVTGPVFCFGPGKGAPIAAADEPAILEHIKLADEKLAEATTKKQTGLKWFKDVTAQVAFLRVELERRYEERKKRAAEPKTEEPPKTEAPPAVEREPGSDDGDEDAPPPWVTG